MNTVPSVVSCSLTTPRRRARTGRLPATQMLAFAAGLCYLPAGLAAEPASAHPPAHAPAHPPARAAATAAAAPAHGPAAKDSPASPAKHLALAKVEAPSAEADAMERLRQRLGERLTTAKPDADAAPVGPLEVRVLAKPAPVRAAAAHGAPHGAAGASGHRAAASAHGKAHAKGHGAAAHAPHWSYAGPAGPQTWGGLQPNFSLCAKGQRQSPIDIQGGLTIELEPVRFNYSASRFAVVDNGHTVQANLNAGNFIELGGKRFELKQFHFHRPSEERIDGRQFEMSVHLVHKDEQGNLAVVGLLLDRGAPHAAVQKVWNNLPLEKQEELPARTPLELNDLLPADRSYYTYMGSLTTPPCSEGVRWIVMRHPVSVSQEQIDLFARLYPMNARPIQQVAGRRILQSQ